MGQKKLLALGLQQSGVRLGLGSLVTSFTNFHEYIFVHVSYNRRPSSKLECLDAFLQIYVCTPIKVYIHKSFSNCIVWGMFFKRATVPSGY